MRRTGHGLNRPETVLVTRDNRILVSDDSDAAVSEVLADGTVVRIGRCPGVTNGLAERPDGSIVFTQFDEGRLWELDLDTERCELLLDNFDGEPTRWMNYPLIDHSGATYLSISSRQEDRRTSIAHRLHDGYILRMDPTGQVTMVMDELAFPNCMTFDVSGQQLYVVCSSTSEIVRFDVTGDGRLINRSRYGPALGNRHETEVGDDYAGVLGDPDLRQRWALADGCAFDAEGNLWVTLMSANRLVAIKPDETVVEIVDDPEGSILQIPTSVAWGGTEQHDLYIGSLTAPYLVTGHSPVPGGRPPGDERSLAPWRNRGSGRFTG